MILIGFEQIAFELFQPFMIQKLISQNHTSNIKTAKNLIDRGEPFIWDILREILQNNTILLNRAPTLHRLGIQAFETFRKSFCKFVASA